MGNCIQYCLYRDNHQQRLEKIEAFLEKKIEPIIEELMVNTAACCTAKKNNKICMF